MKHFLRERLEFYLRDALGFSYDVVNAVLAADADDVVDAVARARSGARRRAICQTSSRSRSASSACKNILKQAKEAGSRAGCRFAGSA